MLFSIVLKCDGSCVASEINHLANIAAWLVSSTGLNSIFLKYYSEFYLRHRFFFFYHSSLSVSFHRSQHRRLVLKANHHVFGKRIEVYGSQSSMPIIISIYMYTLLNCPDTFEWLHKAYLVRVESELWQWLINLDLGYFVCYETSYMYYVCKNRSNTYSLKWNVFSNTFNFCLEILFQFENHICVHY